MAKQKQNKSDWKQLLSAGSVVVAVVGTLIIAWALQSDSEEPAAQMVIEASMPDHQFPAPMPEEEIEPAEAEKFPAESAPAPPPDSGPEPAPEPAVTLSGDLSERARLDRQRMRAAGEGWTLQFATLCSRESTERKLAALSGYERFYLLPARVNDRACHRLCWGLYPSREAALAARGLPRPLTEIGGRPAAMPIDKVAR
jgi:hypothetical protein